jgi:hypothetical protein
MMPYKSDKQRRYMHAKHPGIAARWDKESKVKPAKKAAAKKAAPSFKDRAKAMAKDRVAKKTAPYRKATKKK